MNGIHLGRSWVGTRLEDACPCVKAKCGLVQEFSQGCEQHDPQYARTMRQGHPADHCPGGEA